jgi:two-component sensor histidine kinase
MRVTEFSFDIAPPPSVPAEESALMSVGLLEAAAQADALLISQARDISNGAQFLADLAIAAAAKAKARRMEVHGEIDQLMPLSRARAARLGLIAKELLANAIDHAHPAGVEGEVTIRCELEDGLVVLDVSDDGVGLPDPFDPDTHFGRGLRLVRALAADLGASVRFNSGACGLQVQVRLPAQGD